MNLAPVRLALLCVMVLATSACQPDSQSNASQAGSNADPAQPGSTQLPLNTDTIQVPEANPTATFPAQQREQADPGTIARGEALYGINCRSCHGHDLRGGDMGGPNLLRADTVLQDENGERIGEVIENGSTTPGVGEMPPIGLPENDVRAIAAYIRSVVARGQIQGAPPPVEYDLDIVVGDADAGREHFNELCSGCHAVSGDLDGIASRISEPEHLQNSWVAGRRWGTPDPDADPTRRQVRATITLSDGEVVQGVLQRRDDFVIAITTEDGRYRSFSRNQDTRRRITDLQFDDPLAQHRQLLMELTDDMMHDITAYLVTLK